MLNQELPPKHVDAGDDSDSLEMRDRRAEGDSFQVHSALANV